MQLTGRPSVVIGGGSGIGRGISLALAAEGMSVAIGDIDTASAEVVRDEIIDQGGTAIAVTVDSTDRDSLTQLAQEVIARFGGVSLLSNNVGVAVFRALDEATEHDWAWAIEFNLLAMVRAVDVFLPRLRSEPGGAHIVNTASTAALVVIASPERGWNAAQPIGLYTATKHAVLGYSETLRGELAPYGVGVSVLCPGAVDSTLRASSARNRPARFGGPFVPTERAGYPIAAIGAEEVGRMVVLGVKANRAHILTHPEWAPDVTARYRAVMADFEYFASADERDESGDSHAPRGQGDQTLRPC